MDLSIIIVSWNVKAFLKKCLVSVFKEAGDLSIEVYVVDNASSDGSAEMVEKDFPNVQLIANKKNHGFAKANNQAIKECSGRYVLLLNPDTEILDNALPKMVKFMEDNKKIGVAGCKLLNPNGTLQSSVRMFPDLLSSTLVNLKLHHLKPFLHFLAKHLGSNFNYGKNQEVNQVMGAFFMIRREVVKKIGVLDEGYYIWFEEVDYCARVLEKTDYLIYYTPDAKIIHYGGESFGQVLSLKKQWYYNKSQLRYYFRYKAKWQAVILIILYPFSLFLALLVQIFIPQPKKS